jgi:uncharacterized protein YfdQ (DUF2303 family)
VSIDSSFVEAINEISRDAAAGEELGPGTIYAFRIGDDVKVVDLTGDQYRDAPKRKKGHVVVRDVASFLSYLGKHGDESSEIYADRQQLSVTAVLDAHGQDAPNWGVHRLTLKLKHSDEFEAWRQSSGRMMGQAAFAEFMEEHRSAVREPTGADMLELVQSFHATTKVTFKSGTVLHSGQRQLQYVEETAASAGSKGQLVIPQTFTLGLAVFDGATEADAVTARLRYRIEDGRLQLGFILDRLVDVVTGAYKAVVDSVDAGAEQPILYGTPA